MTEEDEIKNIGTVDYPVYCWKSEIQALARDPEVTWAINLWARTKRWGLPYGGGWAEQPAWVMEILDTVEEANIRYRESELPKGQK